MNSGSLTAFSSSLSTTSSIAALPFMCSLIASVALRSEFSSGSQAIGLCEKRSCAAPNDDIKAIKRLIPITVHGLLTAKSPQPLSIRSAYEYRVREFFCKCRFSAATACFPSGSIESRAGKRTRVKETQNRTPAAPNNPRSDTGATFTGTNESRPPAVVRLVIRIASPECPIA